MRTSTRKSATHSDDLFTMRPTIGETPMTHSFSRALVPALLLVCALAAPAAAAPEGTMTWGVHITLASRWLDPAETEGLITPFMLLYALREWLGNPIAAGPHQP